MKKFILILVILCFSCNLKQKKTQINDPKEIETSKNTASENVQKPYYFKTDSLLVYKKLFDKMFVARQDNNEDNFYQSLFINWTSNNKIEYKLYYENQLCEGECKGMAMRKKTTLKKSAQQKTSKYSFITYEDKKDDISIIIKIDSIEKNKALAGVFDGKYASECSPYEFIMFEQK